MMKWKSTLSGVIIVLFFCVVTLMMLAIDNSLFIKSHVPIFTPMKLPALSFNLTLENIHHTIWNQIEMLQEEGDCAKKKILHCEPLNNFAGFGSMVHRYGACIQVSFALGRMFFIHQNEYKHFGGLTEWLRPESRKCRYLKDKYLSYSSKCSLNDPKCYLPNGYDINNTYKVVTYSPQPGFPMPRNIPGTIPPQVEEMLLKLSVSDPSFWFASQFLGYLLLRPNSKFQEKILAMSKRLNISYPYAAMHIRHGDKLIWEAKYINEKKFIERANDFFDKLSSNVTDRKIYVASDDKAIEEKLGKYSSPRENILMLPLAYREKGFFSYFQNNFPKEVLETFLMDLHFLVYSNFTVCTWSSNIGRLVNILKHVIPPYTARNKVVSMDVTESSYEFYAFGYSNKTKNDFLVSINQHRVLNDSIKYNVGQLFRKSDKKCQGDYVAVKGIHSDLNGCVYAGDVVPWPGKPIYHFYRQN